MKLYELKRNTFFTIEDESCVGEVFFFSHLDGAYSVCYPVFYGDGKRYVANDVVHFSASTPVEVYET